MTEEKAEGRAGLSANARTVLQDLEGRESGATFSELMAAAAMPKTTFRRALNALQSRALVEKREDRYHPAGPAEPEGPRDDGSAPEAGEEPEPAAASGLDETLRALDETRRALSECLRKREDLQVALGELTVADEEALARGAKPDYAAIRQIRESLVETKIEALRLEYEIARLEQRAAREEVEECRAEIYRVRPQIFEKREQIRALEAEIGHLMYLESSADGRIMDLNGANVRRQNYIADTKRRYEAAVRGEPIPEPSVKRNRRGGLVQTSAVDWRMGF